MRRNTYDPVGLLARIGGPYWYRGGLNPAGLLAMLGGMIASALWLNSTLLQGILSHLLSNSDMSVFTGFIVGGVLYWLLAHAFAPRAAPAIQGSDDGEAASM